MLIYIKNPIDGKAFKEEDEKNALQQAGQGLENTTIQKANTLSHEMPDKTCVDEPVVRTFHRNYEAEQ